MHTGRLSTVQDALTAASFSMLSTHPSIPSAILRNTLEQLAFSTEYPLTPQTLTHPLHARRRQIIDYPTTRLHLAGQRAVLGMTGGILSGACVSWAGWYGWLVGSGEGLFGFVGMDAGTAMGVGMLVALSSLRWAVGHWERSKRKWWQDWVRVGEGLDRDLRVRSGGIPLPLMLITQNLFEGNSPRCDARTSHNSRCNDLHHLDKDGSTTGGGD